MSRVSSNRLQERRFHSTVKQVRALCVRVLTHACTSVVVRMHIHSQTHTRVTRACSPKHAGNYEVDRLPIAGATFKRLYTHQRKGIEWLWSLHKKRAGGILGDDMGMVRRACVRTCVLIRIDRWRAH